MNIAKQIIDQRVNAIASENPTFFENDDEERRRSKAFLLLGVAAYLDMDILEAYSYITDGRGDGGLDAVYIEEATEGQVNVVLFQSKYTRDLEKETNFPANAVEKAVNTVRTVFDPNMTVELNEYSRKKVDEIRSLILDGYIPYVTFVMMNNGLPWDDSAQTYIDNNFKGQEQVKFDYFSYEGILGYIEHVTPINTKITMSGLSIQENFNYKRVIVGKLNIAEIKKLMETYGDKLLEKNIRRYLGKNEINDNIAATLRDDDRANFFFYNNGITLICTKYSYNALQEKDWIVNIEGLQIINGGQTCKTIYQTLVENPLINTDQVYVLTRIYELSEDEDIVNEITYATNHQNPVDLRDLKSNDSYQKLLEQGAKDLGYVYKRKRDNMINNSAMTISSTVAAESVFAIWRECPHLAKYKKGEMFGTYYEQIFKDLNAAQLIMAVLIFRACDSNRKKQTTKDGIKAIRPYSNYFVACLAGKKLLVEMGLKLSELTHINFTDVQNYFVENRYLIIEWAENELLKMVLDYFKIEDSKMLADIDGRTMAAAFRRFDIVEKYIKNGMTQSARQTK